MFILSKTHKHQLYLVQYAKGYSLMNKLFGFPTNRAHALDLCLVSMSRTHFSQLLENPTSEDPIPMNMHTERRCC